MTAIVFQNNGLLDKRAVTTMGMSSKDKPDAIGFFGTGLKYAIAVLVKQGVEVIIKTGDEVLEFTKKPVHFRNDNFEVICMNGEELGFTTDLGKKWQMWQAFRELYCNTLDESGSVFEVSPQEAVSHTTEQTTIVVRGEIFTEQFRNKGAIFIDEEDNKLFSCEACDIYNGAGKSVFYRGVKVKDETKTLYKYNIKKAIDLTEDRTAKYEFEVKQNIRKAITQCDVEHVIEAAVTAKSHEFLEGNIDYSEESTQPSKVWMETVSKIHRERMADLNLTAWKLWQKFNTKPIFTDPCVLTAMEQKQLFKAKEFLTKLGMDVSVYPIETYEYLGDGVLALAIRVPDKKIVLSKELFMKGTHYVMRGVMEEYIHLRYGYDDCTRQMQNFLFDKMCHLATEVIGEPL